MQSRSGSGSSLRWIGNPPLRLVIVSMMGCVSVRFEAIEGGPESFGSHTSAPAFANEESVKLVPVYFPSEIAGQRDELCDMPEHKVGHRRKDEAVGKHDLVPKQWGEAYKASSSCWTWAFKASFSRFRASISTLCA